MSAQRRRLADIAVALEPGTTLPDEHREYLREAFRRIADGEDAQSALGLWLPDNTREVIPERDRRLRAMKPNIVLISARARAIRKRLTSYRAGAWQHERSLAQPPEHHRDLWELMRLTEFIPSESRLRRILATGSHNGQKTAL
jgi:hypothetical protein